MDIGRPVSSSVASVSFSFLSTEDIRRISVKQIVNPVLLDNFNQPNLGGLYDPALGPSTQRDVCATCHLDYFQCPGHFGHIELPAPVYHPLFMMVTYKLLRSTCLFCHHFKASRLHVAKTIGKLRLLERGLLEAANALDAANFADEKSKDDEAEQVVEEKIAQKVELYVNINLQHATNAKRGDYKDGPVYQARKAAIDEFLRVALASAKKCQRKQCGAAAYTFRKDGHTKIIEYDLTPKQKVQLDHLGLRRPDAFAYDAAIHRQTIPRETEKRITKSDSRSESGSEMEVDEEINDEEMETDEGSGDDTAEVVHVARAANGRIKGARGRNERVVAPEEVRAHLRWLFRNESTICSLIFGRQGPYAPVNASGFSPVSADIFFLEVLAVSPTRFRPPAKMGEQLFEHPHNQHLTKVINTSYNLRDITAQLRAGSVKESTMSSEERNRILARLFETLIVLQTDVNSYIDSSKNPTPTRQGKLPTPGIKQGLEKKEGLFRMHMMGKRVNYAARSVISPDVNIETNEIGIPPVFARKLTFPEPVTQHNVTELRELVIRGSNPKEGPGANMVQFEDGQTQSLDKLNLEQRTAIANQLLTPKELEKNVNTLRPRAPVVGKKVYRHLRDGDMLILNRQPTLHKPSMMTHKARILPGEKTIRMHYANCNSYNADFDGDEMNVHFPQSQLSRSEAFNLSCTDDQYLVPTSGKPLRGLIQDHVVGGLWLTNKSSFFTREEYQQLVYGALRPENNYTGDGRIHMVPPAILKPQPLWTGKQIISTILKNITPRNASPLTVKSAAQVKEASWGRPRNIHPSNWDSDDVKKDRSQDKYERNLSEERVLVFGGELVRGVLDKSQFGASAYGLVHSVYDVYGAEVAGRLLSIFSRLFTKYLQHRAFTCRMDDLVLTDEGEKARKSTMASGATFGTEAATSFFSDLSQSTKKNEAEKKAELDRLLEKVLRDDAQMAGLDNIVKGKMTGLFEAVIKVIPNGLLRPFPDNHMQAMTTSGAKGSSTNARQISALLGQQELEGRRVPVMVSGKTLPSFRPFETAAIAGGYVASRFLTGLKPQEFYFHCMAGREGLIDTAVKTSRSGYLQRCLIKHLEGIQVHYDHTVRGADSAVYQFLYGEDGLDVTRQMHLSKFGFNLKNQRSLATKFAAKALAGIIDEENANDHMKRVMKKKRKHPDRPLPDPTINTFFPSRHLGAVSEQFAQELDDYISQNKNHLLIVKGNINGRQAIEPTLPSKVFKSLMSVRYIRSLVEPGEAVGLLASQGVGEPSTQMTLNTFHFAGHGAANVTLGIPRLREIVMTAAVNPKTPMMTLPIVKGTPLVKVEEFCQETSQLSLSHLIENIRITEHVRHHHDARSKVFGVEMRFYPQSEYKTVHFVSTRQVILALSKLAAILKRSIQAEVKKLTVDLSAQAASIGKGKTAKESRATGRDDTDDVDADNGDTVVEDNDRDGSEIGDGDADAEKQQTRSKEQATYDEEEGDDADSESEDEAIADETALEAATDSDGEDMDDQGEDRDSEAAEEQGLERALDDIKDVFSSALPLVPDSWRYDHERGLFFELEYDVNMPKLLLVDILERSCVKCIVREVPGIHKSHAPSKSHKAISNGVFTGDADIIVEGTNLRSVAFLGEGVVDVTRISTNSIHAILATYGVEAARASIVKEIKDVFDVYSIKVNIRHLMLIADYMTFDGGFKPFNRRGIATHSSPLLKASYETTAAFLSDATLHGDFDTLSTPSGNIVAGRPARSGTGAFDIVLPIAT
ncbi:probable DNA-directed RNA polymerase I [Serendipita indica DSM 11827]|uniref:DNA-directed RNA polymerase subunit n=1 Tax=Serendipita indica (strain DSM 11827) TaxID=1109443 RepID=G4TND7_SERID|nr:probable DNA-directed RNA polymerase I [Serendipita indica DSM 11827]